MAHHSHPHASGETIGEAYTEALAHALDDHGYLTIHVDDPITSTHVPNTLEWDHWREIVNAGEALSGFESYSFTDGTTGRFWVEDRIEALFRGEYTDRLRKPRNQIEMIVDRL